MTIDQHLEFSVLSAPLASVDRRSLSQAWYSALYAADKTPKCENRCPAPASTSGDSPVCDVAQKQAPIHANSAGPIERVPAREGDTPRASASERRTAQLPLARRIEHRLRCSPKAPRKTSVTLDEPGGRVQLLLCTSGHRVKLVAICSPRAKERVAAALVQARYALAKRGIALEAVQRDGAAC